MLRLPGRRVLNALALAAWQAGLFALDWITGDGNIQALLAVAWTVVLGAAVGRWWLLAVPWLASLGLLAYAELTPPSHCIDCTDETPFIGLVGIAALYAYVADLALLVGLAARAVFAATRRRRARRRAAARASGPRS